MDRDSVQEEEENESAGVSWYVTGHRPDDYSDCNVEIVPTSNHNILIRRQKRRPGSSNKRSLCETDYNHNHTRHRYNTRSSCKRQKTNT